MRSVFLPDELVVLEPNETWNLPGIAIALGIWFVVGLVLTVLTFRWVRKNQ
jgi:ABC-2 type transport system permease protein